MREGNLKRIPDRCKLSCAASATRRIRSLRGAPVRSAGAGPVWPRELPLIDAGASAKFQDNLMPTQFHDGCGRPLFAGLVKARIRGLSRRRESARSPSRKVLALVSPGRDSPGFGHGNRGPLARARGRQDRTHRRARCLPAGGRQTTLPGRAQFLWQALHRHHLGRKPRSGGGRCGGRMSAAPAAGGWRDTGGA